jgi:hypothetical protein
MCPRRTQYRRERASPRKERASGRSLQLVLADLDFHGPELAYAWPVSTSRCGYDVTPLPGDRIAALAAPGPVGVLHEAQGTRDAHAVYLAPLVGDGVVFDGMF